MTVKTWTVNQMLRGFFEDYLVRQRHLSPNTVTAYSHAWRLFLVYLQQNRKRSPCDLLVSDLTSDDVLAFLNDAERNRKNAVRTRNARRAAIRSAIRYAISTNPVLPPAVHQIMGVPEKKTVRPVLGFLEPKEMEALLEAPDPGLWSGRRDRTLLETMYNSGARVSEVAGAKVRDLRLDTPHGQLLLHGKGRKERVLPLWKSTTRHLREWIRENGLAPDEPLFPTTRRQHMTRSLVEKRLAWWVEKAKSECPSLDRLPISPHTIRHTTAMHLLDAGVEITAVSMWLGHESIETTNIYLTSSIERKERALGALQQPDVKTKRFKAQDTLLAYLESL